MPAFKMGSNYARVRLAVCATGGVKRAARVADFRGRQGLEAERVGEIFCLEKRDVVGRRGARRGAGAERSENETGSGHWGIRGATYG